MSKMSEVVAPEGVAAEYGPKRNRPLSKQQRAGLAAYVRYVADRFGLKDWSFELEWDSSTAGGADAADAEISPLFGRKFAVVRFAQDFGRFSPSYQRYLVCHELTHCHLGPVDELCRRTFETALGQTGAAVVQHGYDQASETAVDAIATAFAQHMPLPELG